MNNENTKATELLPIGAAAAVLGIPTRDLRAEVEAGGLPHVRVGDRAILIDVEVVRRTLRARMQGKEVEHD